MKAEWERAAMENLRAKLPQFFAEGFVKLNEDVVVEPVTGKNYDYEMVSTSSHHKVALEIFRLTDKADDIGRSRVWQQIVRLLSEELTALGISDYVIRTPAFNVARVNRKQFAKNIATRLAALIKQNADLPEFENEGYTIRRIHGLGTVHFPASGE